MPVVRPAREALLASYFTLAGAVSPFAPSAISPIPFHKRVEAAGRAGFSGFGLAKDDLEHILGEYDYADIRKILADSGIVHVEVELLRDWFATGEKRRLAESQRRFLLDAAEILGARHIKIGSSGIEYPLEHMIESFATLCDEAAEAGTTIVLEVSPIGRVADLPTGLAVVSGANRSNGGLLLDLWHVTRTKIGYAEISALPKGVIRYVELADGTLTPHGDYLQETVDRRCPCGMGEFDIAGFLSAVVAAGYDGPYGVEILSQENRLLEADDAARLAFTTTTAQFARTITRLNA